MGVEAGGWVEEGVVLGAVDDGFVVGVKGAVPLVDTSGESDGVELGALVTVVDDTDPDVVTTDGIAVTGTRPVLEGSACGSAVHPESTRAAPTNAPTARLLNCVIDLPDPPAERPPGRAYLSAEITCRARTLPELSTRFTGWTALMREITPIV